MKKCSLSLVKTLIAFYFVVAAGSANAAFFWLNDLTVKDISLHWNGIYNLSVYVNEPINTGCAEDSQGLLTYQYSTLNDLTKSMQTLLQQALSTGSKVSLSYKDSCRSGYGAWLYGVRIHGEN